MVFVPSARDKQQDDENNQTLFSWRENKDGEQPFHLPA